MTICDSAPKISVITFDVDYKLRVNRVYFTVPHWIDAIQFIQLIHEES